MNSLRFLIFLAFLFGTHHALSGAQPPNILLILSDDQTWTDYGFMGHPTIDTPTLDQLAAESLTFTRGYVAAPLCRPSLASIITGLPTHLHGTTGNDPDIGDPTIQNLVSRKVKRYQGHHEVLYERLRGVPNMVRLLKNAGYETLQTGKWWEEDPKKFGFTHAMTHGDPDRGGRHGDKGYSISRKGIAPIREFLDECCPPNGESAKPFFIWHAPFLPHIPHSPPAELLAKYQKLTDNEPTARYWAMCEWFDQTCGELLKELDDRHLKQNTLVIYVTDNGWIQDKKRVKKYLPRSKGSPYEGGVRTPLMLRWPKKISPALDIGTLVSSIDIAPTVLQAAGITVPESMTGIDLLDCDALQRRPAVFGSDHPHDIADVQHPNKGVEARYIVCGPWKLIVHDSQEGQTELFHLEADPYEKTNLAAVRPTVVARLQKLLDQWWTPTTEN